MSHFIADSDSPCQLKGGFEFCLLTKVLPLVLEAVTQLLDIVACIRQRGVSKALDLKPNNS